MMGVIQSNRDTFRRLLFNFQKHNPVKNPSSDWWEKIMFVSNVLTDSLIELQQLVK